MLTYTKAETELETCALDEFLKAKKENASNREFLEKINERVVAINNISSIPAEALRNRVALINMVDVVVAENIRHGHPKIFTNDLFKAAGKLQDKLTGVVWANNFHQVIVNATIEVFISNASYKLSFEIFLTEVISILRGRESSEEINQIPDLMIPGTYRVNDRYVNQIHQIYDDKLQEPNIFMDMIRRIISL